MAHFHPLKWTIELPEYKSDDLDNNVEAQSVFVHEFIHYVQTLTGTIGRYILIDLVRISILGGVVREHGSPLPKGFSQVHLREVLGKASKAEFDGTEPVRQYQEFLGELAFALADTRKPYSGVVPTGPFVRATLDVGGFRVDDFVHVLVPVDATTFTVPLTDRVVFENMARQVQRNYLYFNNTFDTSRVDDERSKSHRDITYVCLHDHLKHILPKEEDHTKWTITLCQLALLCRNPGSAFERMYNKLVGIPGTDLNEFIKKLGWDDWFKGEFNEPPIQGVLNELIGKWGTAILPRENWELRELTKCIAHASNALIDGYSFFASPLISWDDVGHWIASFGCPPIMCKDGRCDKLHGIDASMPWHDYFRLADELFSR